MTKNLSVRLFCNFSVFVPVGANFRSFVYPSVGVNELCLVICPFFLRPIFVFRLGLELFVPQVHFIKEPLDLTLLHRIRPRSTQKTIHPAAL